MGIRSYKPRTPGTRHCSLTVSTDLTSSKPERTLLKSHHRSMGRNNRGIITSRHRGGGQKRRYRRIDFRRNKLNVSALIQSFEYDPNRNARIILLLYADGEKSYILAPDQLGNRKSKMLISSENAPVQVGNALPLRNIPLGTPIHNIELRPQKGGQLARAAGTFGEIVAKSGTFATVRLPSKELRLISQDCKATIGQVGNGDSMNRNLGKAGRRRWYGQRPAVRGSAKNPVDHPHGGGEGRAPIGRSHPVTPWGHPALGLKTRRKSKGRSFILTK